MELLFQKNENENNETVSKLFMGLAAFILVIWLFCLLGIFDFDKKAATVFAGVSVVTLNLPVVFIYLFHLNKPFLKYVLIGILSLVMGLCYCIFTFQMVIMFLLPCLTAMLYLDRKLLYFSGAFHFAVILGAHIITNFYVLQPWLEPFMGMKNIIRFGVAPRMMQLGVCFWILVVLMNRMLSYLEQLQEINEERISDIAAPDREADEKLIDPDRQEYETCLKSLTEREREVFVQMLLGKTNMQIAETLCLSMGTVKNYVSSIYDKTGKKERNYFILKFGRFAVSYDQSHRGL